MHTEQPGRLEKGAKVKPAALPPSQQPDPDPPALLQMKADLSGMDFRSQLDHVRPPMPVSPPESSSPTGGSATVQQTASPQGAPVAAHATAPAMAVQMTGDPPGDSAAPTEGGSGDANAALKKQVSDFLKHVPPVSIPELQQTEQQAKKLEESCTAAGLKDEADKLMMVSWGASSAASVLNDGKSTTDFSALKLGLGLALNKTSQTMALIAVTDRFTVLEKAIEAYLTVADPPKEEMLAVQEKLTQIKNTLTEGELTAAAGEVQRKKLDPVSEAVTTEAKALGAGTDPKGYEAMAAIAALHTRAAGFNQIKSWMTELMMRAWAIGQVAKIYEAGNCEDQDLLLLEAGQIREYLAKENGDPRISLTAPKHYSTLDGIDEVRALTKELDDLLDPKDEPQQVEVANNPAEEAADQQARQQAIQEGAAEVARRQAELSQLTGLKAEIASKEVVTEPQKTSFLEKAKAVLTACLSPSTLIDSVLTSLFKKPEEPKDFEKIKQGQTLQALGNASSLPWLVVQASLPVLAMIPCPVTLVLNTVGKYLEKKGAGYSGIQAGVFAFGELLAVVVPGLFSAIPTLVNLFFSVHDTAAATSGVETAANDQAKAEEQRAAIQQQLDFLTSYLTQLKTLQQRFEEKSFKAPQRLTDAITTYLNHQVFLETQRDQIMAPGK